MGARSARGLQRRASSSIPHHASRVTCSAKAASLSTPTGLQSWAESVGAKAPKVAISSSQGERGLKATDSIAAGEDIAMIPRSMALVVTDVSTCPCPDVVDPAFFRKSTRLLKLAITLLYERGLGSESKVAPYIAALPEAVDLPCMWDSKSLAWLQNSGLRDQIAEQAAQWHTWNEQLHATSPRCPWSEADLQWALACVVSRAFTGPHIGSTVQGRLNLLLLVSGATALTLTLGVAEEGQVLSAALASIVFNVLFELLRSRQVKQYTLCPLVDMANHRSGVGTEVEYDYFRDAFFAQATAPFRRGDEVVISYGAQTTDSLLQFYGFVEAVDSPDDVYTLHGLADALHARADPARWADVEARRAQGGMPSLERVALTDKAQVPDEVKSALRYLLGVAGSLEDAQEKVSNKADAVVWQFVLDVARADQQENGLGGKGEQMALKAAKKGGQKREAVARAYNVRKGKFLGARIEQLQRRVTQMLAKA